MMYDVFISHASENSDVASSLAETLARDGASVWIDKTELRLGSPLRRNIEKGLNESRFLIVLFSPAFFGKPWTESELDVIARRLREQPGVFLPILHELTSPELARRAPMLADCLSASTSLGIEAVADMIMKVIREQKFDPSDQLVARAEKFLETGGYSEALREANECLRIDPAHAGAYLCRSRARFWQGSYREAEDDANRALARDPGLAPALLMRAQARWMLGRSEEGLTDCAALLRLEPHSGADHVAHAFASGMLGDLRRASEDVDIALRLEPGDPTALAARAFLLMAHGKIEEALADAQAVLLINPRNPSALLIRAQGNLFRGEVKQALDDATEALSLQPNNPMSLAARAEIYLCTGRPYDAIRDASAALDIDSSNLYALNLRATALSQTNDPRWSVDARTIIDTPPRTPVDRVMRGRAYLALNRPGDALAEMNQALSDDPSNQPALAFRASLHAGAQRFDDALRDARSALSLNPRNVPALQVRAHVALSTGDFRQAAQDAVEMLRINPADPAAGNILDLARNPWKLSMMNGGNSFPGPPNAPFHGPPPLPPSNR